MMKTVLLLDGGYLRATAQNAGMSYDDGIQRILEDALFRGSDVGGVSDADFARPHHSLSS